jgi:LmbE family N-acetylglucosaminyl deacetylase
VLAPSPERWWERIQASHPDHLAVGEAAACAVYPDARNPFAHPELLDEGLEPHVVGELWLMASPVRNVAVEITAAFERKIAALLCHRTQIGDPDAIVAPRASRSRHRGAGRGHARRRASRGVPTRAHELRTSSPSAARSARPQRPVAHALSARAA